MGDDDGGAWRGLRRRSLAADGKGRADDADGAGPMMSGCVDRPFRPATSGPRLYEVVSRGGGWSISLNGACTRPFRSRRAAERIASMLQRQADALARQPERAGRHA